MMEEETSTDKNLFHASPINLNVMEMPNLSWEVIARCQEEEAFTRKIKMFLRGELDSQDPDSIRLTAENAINKWRLLDDVLLIRIRPDSEVFKIWMPKVLVPGIIWLVHTKLAHFGADKVDKAIAEICHWRGRKKQVRKMIASCITCQRTKYPNRHYAGERKAIIPTKANELVALDLYGPLPKTKYGFKHLFVCVDVFSKFVQVYCINRPNSKNCIHQLDKFFRKAGEYEKVLTDNGPQFTSECWSRAMEEKHYSHLGKH